MSEKYQHWGFLPLTSKITNPSTEENEREKGEMRGTLIKPERNARSKHCKLKKRQIAYLFIPNSLKLSPFLMEFDHKLRRDGPSSCEETASHQNRKENHNLLAIPGYSKRKFQEQTAGTLI